MRRWVGDLERSLRSLLCSLGLASRDLSANYWVRPVLDVTFVPGCDRLEAPHSSGSFWLTLFHPTCPTPHLRATPHQTSSVFLCATGTAPSVIDNRVCRPECARRTAHEAGRISLPRWRGDQPPSIPRRKKDAGSTELNRPIHLLQRSIVLI